MKAEEYLPIWYENKYDTKWQDGQSLMLYNQLEFAEDYAKQENKKLLTALENLLYFEVTDEAKVKDAARHILLSFSQDNQKFKEDG